jgi:hypothetical protein
VTPDAVTRELQVLASRPVCQPAVMRDLEVPAALDQVALEGQLISPRDRDVDVFVRAGLAVQIQVDGPAAAERPRAGRSPP